MKKLFLLFLFAGAVSCIDNDYDLSNIDTDNVTIGGDESEFRMPVAHICMSVNQLCQSSGQDAVSVLELYREADIWLPSTLPGNAEYVEVVRLGSDDAYLASLLEALFDEMDRSESKRMEVCELVANRYRQPFVDFLPSDVPSEVRQQVTSASDEEAARLIAELYVQMRSQVSASITEIATTYLCDMQLDDVVYEIPGLDLSSDVRDMLVENLDPASVDNPVNALYLTGSIDCEFPFLFRLEPRIEQTHIDFGEIEVDNGRTTTLDEVRFYTEDFDRLYMGSRLLMPVTVERYYPSRGIDENQLVNIHLSLLKTGGLTL